MIKMLLKRLKKLLFENIYEIMFKKHPKKSKKNFN